MVWFSTYVEIENAADEHKGCHHGNSSVEYTILEAWGQIVTGRTDGTLWSIMILMMNICGAYERS
jgi:hypothetical protein